MVQAADFRRLRNIFILGEVYLGSRRILISRYSPRRHGGHGEDFGILMEFLRNLCAFVANGDFKRDLEPIPKPTSAADTPL